VLVQPIDMPQPDNVTSACAALTTKSWHSRLRVGRPGVVGNGHRALARRRIKAGCHRASALRSINAALETFTIDDQFYPRCTPAARHQLGRWTAARGARRRKAGDCPRGIRLSAVSAHGTDL